MDGRIVLAQESGISSETLGLYLLPLIGSIFLAYAIYNLVSDMRKPGSKRVAERLRGRGSGMEDGFASNKVRESILRQKAEPVSGIGAAIARLGVAANLQRLLEQANLQWTVGTFVVQVIGLSAIGYIALYFLDFPQWAQIATGAGLLVLPFVAVYVKRSMRMNKFLNQLPDVFDLMGQALRAGHSLPNAILLVGQQMQDPVGTEFARVFHEQNLGIKMEDSLKDMAKRVDLMDVRFFVTAVLIQRQTGGDLAEVLDNISGVIRDRIKLFGTVKALTAEGRLSGWVLLALPIVVFIMELTVNPDYANVLLEDPLGQYMLMGAGVAQLLGLAMIQKIVNIKV